MPNQPKPKEELTPEQKLIKALIEFQKTCPSIAKAKEGYGYKYTPLERFLSVVNPALHKVGLVQNQIYDFEEGRTIIVTTLAHEGGALVRSRLPVRDPLGKSPKKDIMHEWGGITTYSRRYALKMILGLEPDMDMNLEDVIERDPPQPKITRTPRVNGQKTMNNMVSNLTKTPIDKLKDELAELPANQRSEGLQQFQALRFPNANVAGNLGLFGLIKTEQHIQEVQSIIEEMKSDSP